MNVGNARPLRKKSFIENHSASFIQPDVKYKRQRSFQGKNTRDRDFFAPDEIEEWVLPQYRSIFHHLFLKEDEDQSSGGGGTADANLNATSNTTNRNRRVSLTGSRTSASSDDDGPIGTFLKTFKQFPSWFKKMFQSSDGNDERQQNSQQIDRHVWLDEIPIEICDKLRHIHIYL
ncbi:hypothetical protein Ocin01_10524 [Orchesella cincta]|uniref:Uncharacterized protein n=1 Tax=Orchesella cincta TaxID=48709 RepID=A0A1D2MTD2_ORCCI|nr:hypothetical protein Ocin01_10524 [Orchesella cincta]